MTRTPVRESSDRLGSPLGTSRSDWRRRLLLHHVPLGLASAVLFTMLMSLAQSSGIGSIDMVSGSVLPEGRAAAGGGEAALWSTGFWALATTATGYVAALLLGLTLLVGPANLMLRRRNPVSNYLRRDLGTWTAITSVIHVIAGLQLHGSPGDILTTLRSYFLTGDGLPQANSFGLGNWTGLAATIIVVGLLVISTDRAMRELKPKRWKDLQRLNYSLFALVVLHAFFYGAFLEANSPFTYLIITVTATVLIGQLAGIRLWRRKRARTPVVQREPRSTGAAR